MKTVESNKPVRRPHYKQRLIKLQASESRLCSFAAEKEDETGCTLVDGAEHLKAVAGGSLERSTVTVENSGAHSVDVVKAGGKWVVYISSAAIDGPLFGDSYYKACTDSVLNVCELVDDVARFIIEVYVLIAKNLAEQKELQLLINANQAQQSVLSK